MKTNYIQQEILLMTGSTFLTRQLCEKEPGKENILPQREQLEEACWNGLLKEMVPELYKQTGDHKIFLWQIREGKSFIELELGEIPDEKDKQFSIDPYSFIVLQSLS